MTLRFSPALQNFIAEDGDWKDFFNNGSIQIYSGAQPATPNLAATGVLLATITNNAGALTSEVASAGSVTLNTGAAGSVDTLTVNGLEIMGSSTPFNTSLTQTAADVALKCNRNPKNKLFKVTSAGAVITITARPGLGTLPNAWVVASTVTTITKTDANMAGGVNSANGLLMDYNAAAGVFSKQAAQVWSGTAVATGTAGYFRYVSSVADAQALDNSAVFLRMDGACATSGAEMNMSSTAVASGALQTVSTFSVTVPAQ